MDRRENLPVNWSSLQSLARQRIETRKGISIIETEHEPEGSMIAKEILYEMTGDSTVIFFSGGRTPVNLYSALASEHRLAIGAAAMVDERYGKPMHDTSNELMIMRTGLTDYFKRENIPFFKILENGKNLADTSAIYNEKVRYLLSTCSKSEAILGIGEDGHIAGIAPNRPDFFNPLFSKENKGKLVSYFDDRDRFGARVTLTFESLYRLTALIVLVFGEKKQAALSRLFSRGPETQVPSRFLKRIEVARKTLLITDQRV
jgi:6-phosphogluconolactonase/glucosamine-6-phosphate isomerase/deaminase